MHFLLSVSSPRRLQRALVRLPCGQLAAPLYSVAVPQPYAVVIEERVWGPIDLNFGGKDNLCCMWIWIGVYLR